MFTQRRPHAPVATLGQSVEIAGGLLQRLRLPVQLVRGADRVEHTAGYGQHLPAVNCILQSLFDDRQLKALVCQLLIAGQGGPLLAEPAPFFQPLAELLLHHRQPLAQFLAARLRRHGLGAFKLTADCVFRTLRRDGRLDFPVDRFALASKRVGPRAFECPLPEFLLVLGPRFEEQLPSSMFQADDRLFVFGPFQSNPPGLDPQRVAPGGGGLLPGGRRGKLAQLLHRVVRAERHAGVGRKLHDPRGQRFQLLPAARKVFATLPEATLDLTDPVAVSHQPPNLFRMQIVRQTGCREGLAPTPSCAAQFLFRLARLALRGLDLLPRRAAARV